jgi:hypothetical protein
MQQTNQFMERLQIRTQTEPKKLRWEAPTCDSCARKLCSFRTLNTKSVCNLWKSGYSLKKRETWKTERVFNIKDPSLTTSKSLVSNGEGQV